jgi:hypothetical protein
MTFAEAGDSPEEEAMNTAVRENDDAAAVKIPPLGTPRHEDALIDQALLETFPASDPISPAVEARMQAAEDAAESRRESPAPPLGRRLLRVAPTLIAFSVFAVALSAFRSKKSQRRYAK